MKSVKTAQGAFMATESDGGFSQTGEDGQPIFGDCETDVPSPSLASSRCAGGTDSTGARFFEFLSHRAM